MLGTLTTLLSFAFVLGVLIFVHELGHFLAAKRVGIRRLSGEMVWSNRPMQMLAQATGFSVEAVPGDRNRRALVLTLK